MFSDRLDLYNKIEELRGSKLLVYVTGNRPGLETQIAEDALHMFSEHLDQINHTEKISLFLYTLGGNTLTAWSLVNLIRSYCNQLEIIIPSSCFSSGTLICLGANKLVMTKQASLGPIDPSVNGPLNPSIPGFADPNAKVPVSVEHVNAYLELAQNQLGIKDQGCLTQLLINLSNQIHPLTLGQVYKSRTQIQMLARNLLKWQSLDKEKEDSIISFLCSESGSHDYSIRRREASEKLGLNIEKPTEELYLVIKKIFKNICEDIKLNEPYNPLMEIQKNGDRHDYCHIRGIIDSVGYGSNIFISKGTIIKQNVATPQGPQMMINDQRTSEGWEIDK
ncbi:hypothetical protein SDC9_20258 [bioreactor metagenome]|uniref:Serine protease n=1 Tax=bioreactor metagenome TaxID=1076179 RepID=A0A644U688_9ZZZZ